MWWFVILYFLDAVALQFINWPSDRYGGGSYYSRPAFLLNSVMLQFVNRFSLGAALQFARQLSLGVALQFASRFFTGGQRSNSLANSRREFSS